MKKIYPCIWFDDKAKVAAEFYCSIFESGKILEETPIVVTFELFGQKFMGLNGGPRFVPNEAVSFVVDCETQEEVDFYWNSLSAGGEESMCGWLKDKFGVWWQIVPTILPELLNDPEKGEKVANEMFKMQKLDIQKLLNAFQG